MMIFLVELGLGLAYAWKKGRSNGSDARPRADPMPTEEELARLAGWFRASRRKKLESFAEPRRKGLSW
jgi:hypothetical protein